MPIKALDVNSKAHLPGLQFNVAFDHGGAQV